MANFCIGPDARTATLAEYPARFFEFDNFVTRDHCGNWIPEIASVHYWGDVLYALSYFTIPLTVLHGWLMWRVSVFPNLLIAMGFCSFIMICGADHVFSSLAFHFGIYDQQAITKGLGAFVSVCVSVMVVWWTSTERGRKRNREIGEIATAEFGLSKIPMCEVRDLIKEARHTMQESREFLQGKSNVNSGDR